MVRLKANRQHKKTARYHQFQFLMVRLKEQCIRTHSIAGKFQFLMVRLKAIIYICRKVSAFISIPYGSIKSPVRKVRLPLCTLISIPYGSIKSPTSFPRIYQYRISIPYGSIKRISRTALSCASFYFNSLWFD